MKPQKPPAIADASIVRIMKAIEYPQSWLVWLWEALAIRAVAWDGPAPVERQFRDCPCFRVGACTSYCDRGIWMRATGHPDAPKTESSTLHAPEEKT